ncbi:hypothetical protein O181_075799 [Austropuccinia psidii MF-1]|uniref:Tf2-1-like SH3-like domain-containing protein n=1 Tax=Austropuccinia psidii MF-1 TaxID=1389203 RepID=A0A9Q3FB92_9BASI|nr:hypothetical protein [Austropuccinia psidii MF-1]
MWKTACDKAEKCIVEAKLYNEQRYEKSHQEHSFKEEEQVIISTKNFNKFKFSKKMRDSFVGPFTIIRLIEKNAVEFRLTEEFFREHPVFPVSLVKHMMKNFPTGKK